jgi:two-component system chemotaxis response regulator CheY
MARTALVVDDSTSIRQMIAFTLKKAGFDIVEGENGQDGLAKLGGQRVDLIITDLNMPVMDGITFLQSVRKLESMRYTPVLLLTTETSKEKRHQAKAAGATGWLTKPFNPQQLADAVERLLL